MFSEDDDKFQVVQYRRRNFYVKQSRIHDSSEYRHELVRFPNRCMEIKVIAVPRNKTRRLNRVDIRIGTKFLRQLWVRVVAINLSRI